MTGKTRNLSRRAFACGAAALGVSGTNLPRARAEAASSMVPDPIAHLVTRWRQDRFSRGAYSYLAREAVPEDRTWLARPIENRLFFAGEATHGLYPATVHGAMLSGERAAGEVLNAGAKTLVIVGAGIAGLAAAHRLAANGVQVSVLEARDRTGGRIWTDDSLGVPLDLGASWIHGITGNPLTRMADAAGLERFQTDYQSLMVRNHFGQVVDTADFPDHYRTVSQIELEFGADAADLSAEAGSEGGAFTGGDALLPAGYARILDGFKGGYDVQLGAEVSAVVRHKKTVEVHTRDETLQADAALVTVPLGVLKAGAIAFSPALPRTQLAAIRRLGMGVLDKVYLKFDEIFWDADADLLGFIGPQRGHFAEWLNMAKVTGAPILLGFNAGSVADNLEARSDDEIVAEAMGALRAMYQPQS